MPVTVIPPKLLENVSIDAWVDLVSQGALFPFCGLRFPKPTTQEPVCISRFVGIPVDDLGSGSVSIDASVSIGFEGSCEMLTDLRRL